MIRSLLLALLALQATTAALVKTDNGCYKGTSDEVTAACDADGAGCCMGTNACDWPDDLDMTVCPNSCNGLMACRIRKVKNKDDYTVVIGEGSCNEREACENIGRGYNNNLGQDTTVGVGSCNDPLHDSFGKSCNGAVGDIADLACIGTRACFSTYGGVGPNSCIGDHACAYLREGVLESSCISDKACQHSIGPIGNGSCQSKRACFQVTGEIGDCVSECSGAGCTSDKGTFIQDTDEDKSYCEYFTGEEPQPEEPEPEPVSDATVTAKGCFQGTAAEVTKACAGSFCCEGHLACDWPDTMKMTVCPDSCNGDSACLIQSVSASKDQYKIHVGFGSCNGKKACMDAGRGATGGKAKDVRIEDDSCNDSSNEKIGETCAGIVGDIGRSSCFGDRACRDAGGDVLDGSCVGDFACKDLKRSAGESACLGEYTCFKAKGHIGSGSCTVLHGCDRAKGSVGECVAECEEKTMCPDDEGMYNPVDGTCNYDPEDDDDDDVQDRPSFPAIVTKEGCFQGTAAQVHQACIDNNANCCIGFKACSAPDTVGMTVCPGSCLGDKACSVGHKMGKNNHNIYVEAGSCLGRMACRDLGRGYQKERGTDTTIGKGSCIVTPEGVEPEDGDIWGKACAYVHGTVGNNSCLGMKSCMAVDGDVGEKSCHGKLACTAVENDIEDFSCFGKKACDSAVGPIGSGSCPEDFSCEIATGEIGDCVEECRDNECPDDRAIFDAATQSCPDTSASPSAAPSQAASDSPSSTPSVAPSETSSGSPSFSPSAAPSETSSGSPSASPSVQASESPSSTPSLRGSESPSASPSASPVAATRSGACSSDGVTITTVTYTMTDDSGVETEAEAVCYTGTSDAVTCACENCCGKKDKSGEPYRYACDWLPESTVTVCEHSCNDGVRACQQDKPATLKIMPYSCNGHQACRDVGQLNDFSDDPERCADGSCDVEIGFGSCNDAVACSRCRGHVGNGSCNHISACYLAEVEGEHNDHGTCNEQGECAGAVDGRMLLDDLAFLEEVLH